MHRKLKHGYTAMTRTVSIVYFLQHCLVNKHILDMLVYKDNVVKIIQLMDIMTIGHSMIS